ncbi:Outer membrane scaffolding protein for murein synthesis, MipA/OmpV family [Rhodoblastus acidophilus]|uniref:Outer membrane scaffolding protein for murein synthesis, MipA/OmpV family n=1 Tax=Rhodoblastus acidophilus TaxID=1074 RepID=A0A212Q989_RHOAC|nr:MipA/OmpV family protein [Rhodoblastus acidophilus]SNB55941.1 Outer membrane scaffolding protein for murein synthesis, MipA/OmpV family [Rhodoblastus acidophilus]
MKFAARNILCLLATGAACAAQAADLPSSKAPVTPAPALEDWFVTVSGQVSFGPSYPGARRYDFSGIPGISLRRVGEKAPFSTPDDGFNFSFYSDDLFRFGAVGRLVGDRSSRDNNALRGLRYVPYSLELGGFGEITPTSWSRLRVELRQAVTGHDGLVATVGGDVWQSWRGFTLSAGPRFYFGNDKYAKSYFSVSQNDAVANNALGGKLYRYDATGGLTALGATTALRYEVNNDWRATAFANYQRLTGSVADSPLAYSPGNGDRNQWTYGLGVAYRFRTTGQFIPGLF